MARTSVSTRTTRTSPGACRTIAVPPSTSESQVRAPLTPQRHGNADGLGLAVDVLVAVGVIVLQGLVAQRVAGPHALVARRGLGHDAALEVDALRGRQRVALGAAAYRLVDRPPCCRR